MNTQHTQALNQLVGIFKTVAQKVQQQQISNFEVDEDAESSRVEDPATL